MRDAPAQTDCGGARVLGSRAALPVESEPAHGAVLGGLRAGRLFGFVGRLLRDDRVHSVRVHVEVARRALVAEPAPDAETLINDEPGRHPRSCSVTPFPQGPYTE